MAVVAEHRDGPPGVAGDHNLVRLERSRRVFWKVRQPREVREGPAAVDPREGVLAQDVGSSHRGDFPERVEGSVVGERRVPRGVEGALPRRARDDGGGALREETPHFVRVHRLRIAPPDRLLDGEDLAQRHEGAVRSVGLLPAAIVRHDEGRDAALGRRRGVALAPPRRLEGVDRVRANGARDVGSANPRAHGRREGLDVRLEQRVGSVVPGGLVADDDENWGVGATRVVEVGEGVCEPRAEVQEGARGLARHPRVPVRGAAHDRLVEAEHRSNRVGAEGVQRAHEPHLRRAGVREAHVHAALVQGADEGLGAILGRGARGDRGRASRGHGDERCGARVEARCRGEKRPTDVKNARPPDFPRLRRFRGGSSCYRSLPHRAADQSPHGRREHRAPG